MAGSRMARAAKPRPICRPPSSAGWATRCARAGANERLSARSKAQRSTERRAERERRNAVKHVRRKGEVVHHQRLAQAQTKAYFERRRRRELEPSRPANDRK